LAAPAQRSWSFDGMLHRQACALRGQIRRFESEIPLREAIGIVNQHQTGGMFESFGLPFHGELVLTEKDAAKDIEDLFREGKRWKDIPRGREFYARAICVDGNNNCPVREPVIADANLLDANVGQGELDGCADRIPVEAQELVGSAVG